MKTNLKPLILLVLVLITHLLSAQILDIHIRDVRNQKGQLCVAVFANQKNFNAEKTFYDMKFSKNELVNGELHVQLALKPGKFGVSVLDDEDKSGKMEYGFLGIPKKGFGFSDYYLKGFTKPSFDDFCFTVEKNQVKKLVVRMKYFIK
jgi:uncharacterized protein (DUF2141 family)